MQADDGADGVELLDTAPEVAGALDSLELLLQFPDAGSAVCSRSWNDSTAKKKCI